MKPSLPPHQTILETARVLVIDDEVQVADMLCQVLEGNGYQHVERIADPREAAATYERFQPDLIVLDWMMPELSGAAVLRQLREKIPTNDYLPILVVTAMPQFAIKEEALGNGATDFLNKPYDPSEIVLRAGNLLATRFLHLQLEEQNRLLEKRVEERTAELQKANAALQFEVAERGKTAEALHRADVEWQQSFDATPDYLCILDRDGKILRANRPMRERFEPLHGNLRGVDYGVCYCGTDSPQEQLPCAEVIRSGQPVIWEGKLPTLDGWYLIAGYPLTDDAGAQWGAMSVVRDLTPRREAENALRVIQEELEDRVRARTGELELANVTLSTQSIMSQRAEKAATFQAHIIGTMSEAVIAADPAGRIIYVNDFAQRLYGWPAEEMMGRDLVELIAAPASYKQGREIVEAVAATGKSWTGEFLVHHRDGSTFVSEMTDSPLRDERGELTAIISLSHDISERKKAEEALRITEEKFKVAIEGAGLGTWDWNADTSEILCCARAEEMFGVLAGAGVSLDAFLNVIPPEERDAIAIALQRCVETRQPYEMTHRVQWPDGSVHVISARGGVRRDDGVTHISGTVEDITQREEMARALRETEARYAAVVANVPGVVFRVIRRPDRSSAYRFVSEGCRTLLGIEPTEFEQQPQIFDDLVHVADRATFLTTKSDALATGRDFTWEGRIRTRSGETKWIGAVARGETQADGNMAWDGVLIDFTERRRAEEALRESDARYKQIVETAQEGIWVIDAEGATTFANPKMEQMLGVAPHAMIGRSMFDFMDVKARAEAEGNLGRRRNGVAEQHEFCFIKADGSQLWALLATNPLPALQGGFAGALAMVTDITERKRATEQLALSARQNNQLAAAIATLTSGVVIADPNLPDAPIVFANSAFCALTGYSAEETLGRNCRFLQGAETDPASVQAMRKAIAARRPYSGEVLNYRKDSTTFWNELTITPVFDDGGALINFVGLQSDITERRRIHLALQEAKAEAERANAAKSEFLSRMSHELRTPLNGILGFAQLAGLDARTADERENVEQIQSAGAHLLQLINEILDLSSIEAGRMQLSIQPVKLRGAFQSALAVVRPLAAARKIEVGEFACDRYVLADEQRLQQVLLNLLGNAVKYNKDGGSVAFTCALTSYGSIRVEIKDTGKGIAALDLPNLFQPFQRFHAEENIEGIGLGLAISQRLVHAMGGTIGADSMPSVGSTFWIELPAGEEFWERDEEVARSAISNQQPASSHPKTLLYIEDNLSNVKLVERILLHRPQVRFLTAQGGSSGLQMAVEHRPDLILLDLHLPDMNGDQVLIWLQSKPQTAQIPVVLLSANAIGGEIARLKELGAHDYMTKPFRVPEFLQMVDGLLAER